ncbi:hypothetical protein D6D11_10697 [Aureobasidium pullulans]|nr:hypothetical protein D6D11_10697 [Aureobasidium pullulans]
MPHERITVTYMHMYLQEHTSGNFNVDVLQDFQDRLKTAEVVQANGGFSQNEFSAATIFRVIAQAVRLHDLGYSILRSKLEYLVTLQFQRLVDIQFRYARERVMRQNPGGTTSNFPASLADPSWPEESRILWVLWILTIARLISYRYAACSYDNALKYLVRSQVRLSPLAHRWTDNAIAEITSCMLTGTTLQPPTDSRGSAWRHPGSDHSLILQPYQIPCPPYMKVTSDSKGTMPTSPMFSWNPAVISESSLNAVVWDIIDPMLLRENPAARYVRAMRNSPDSPIQASDSNVFDRLGFGFWDRRRVSADFHLLMPPRNHDVVKNNPSLYALGGSNHVSRSDGLFRLLSIYKQEKEREQSGWKRGFWSRLRE